MEILPAIDLRDGKCVRLIQGDYKQQIDYSPDPAEVAAGFEQAGARWIHIVDLDGARTGQMKNLPAIKAIRQATDLSVEVGGGIRTLRAMQQLLEIGVTRVILGTQALKNWPWFEELTKLPELAHKLVLGLDARGGKLAVQGWTDQTQQTPVQIAGLVRGWPLAAIIHTDISRDGMLAGPNLQATEELALATTVPVIAAGGVTSPQDVEALAELPLAGIIIGRALYENRIQLTEALKIARRTR